MSNFVGQNLLCYLPDQFKFSIENVNKVEHASIIKVEKYITMVEHVIEVENVTSREKMLHQRRKCNIKEEKHLIKVENVIKIENAT